MNGQTIHKKLISVFHVNGRVVVKNLPDNPGNIGTILSKYAERDHVIFYHSYPLNDRKFPIQETIKTLKNEKSK